MNTLLEQYRYYQEDDGDTCRVPQWKVVNSLGKVIGVVYGYSERDAIKSVEESPCYDCLHAFRVEKL
jgi:hypothetical protein